MDCRIDMTLLWTNEWNTNSNHPWFTFNASIKYSVAKNIGYLIPEIVGSWFSLSNVDPSRCWMVKRYCGADAGPRKTGRIYQSAPSHIIVVQVPHALVCAWYIWSVCCVVHTAVWKGGTQCALRGTHCRVVRGSLSSHSAPAICKLELPLLINSALSSLL